MIIYSERRMNFKTEEFVSVRAYTLDLNPEDTGISIIVVNTYADNIPYEKIIALRSLQSKVIREAIKIFDKLVEEHPAL